MERKFILSSRRFSNSPEIDYNLTFELQNSNKNIDNDTNIDNIDLSELFNIERNRSNQYRLLGRIEYLSILNNLKNNYNNITDLFIRYDKSNTNKNIFNSFKIYLLAKSDTYTSLGNDLYKERYEVIADISDIQVYNCGFSKNIFYEQQYLFNYNIEFNLDNKKDYFNKPITELYIYFDYQLNISKGEILLKKEYNQFSNESNNLTITETTNTNYELGDLIIGNLVKRGDTDFDEIIVNNQEYKIRLNIQGNLLIFKYNPFLKIKLRDYNDVIYYGNTKNNSRNIINIPDYAKTVGNVNDGNVIWKELLPHGVIDPISNLGVNFPFVNGKHYVYTNNILAIQPDLSDLNTNFIFEKIKMNGFNTDLFILKNPDKDIC